MTYTVLPSSQWVAADHNRVLEAHGLLAPEALPAGVATSALSNRDGNWARIEKLPANQLRLSVDRGMTIPLYYGLRNGGSGAGDTIAEAATSDNSVPETPVLGQTATTGTAASRQHAGERPQWFIGLSAAAVAGACGIKKRSRHGALALRNCGFTLGADTLFAGVYSVPAGSSVILPENPTETVTVQTWGAPHWSEPALNDATEFGAQLLRALMDSTKATLTAAGDAQILVPFTGSLEARMLLFLLKLLGARNVLTFTVGQADDAHVEVARELTSALNFPWIHLEQDEKLSAYWESALSRDYIAATWSGFALPDLRDFAALLQLRERGLLHAGDVVLNDSHWCGHFPLSPQVNDYSAANCARMLAQALWNFQGRGLGNMEDRDIWRDALAASARAVDWREERATTQALLTWFLANERDSKTVGSRLRGYEYFGLRWGQPLASDTVFNAWYRGGEEFTGRAQWYTNFVDGLWADAAGAPPARITKRQVPVNVGWRNSLLQTLAALGIRAGQTEIIQRQMRALPDWRAYCTQIPVKQLDQELASGVTPYGVFANLLLANNWGSMAAAISPIVPQ